MFLPETMLTEIQTNLKVLINGFCGQALVGEEMLYQAEILSASAVFAGMAPYRRAKGARNL